MNPEDIMNEDFLKQFSNVDNYIPFGIAPKRSDRNDLEGELYPIWTMANSTRAIPRN